MTPLASAGRHCPLLVLSLLFVHRIASSSVVDRAAMPCPARLTCGASEHRNDGHHRLNVIKKQLDDLGGANVVGRLLREYRLLNGIELVSVQDR